MPQMAPLSWLLLYIMFIIIFLLFSVLNYFSFLYPVKQVPKKKSMRKINWKW
nr:ATP synthase F0 subunit 8 [Trichogomphus mongol]